MTDVSRIIASLLEVALIFPSERVEKNQRRNSTEYFSAKAYLHFRYWAFMSHTLYATDLKGKQFFDAEVKIPAKKKKKKEKGRLKLFSSGLLWTSCRV